MQLAFLLNKLGLAFTFLVEKEAILPIAQALFQIFASQQQPTSIPTSQLYSRRTSVWKRKENA
jgi:hypothetical protein